MFHDYWQFRTVQIFINTLYKPGEISSTRVRKYGLRSWSRSCKSIFEYCKNATASLKGSRTQISCFYCVQCQKSSTRNLRQGRKIRIQERDRLGSECKNRFGNLKVIWQRYRKDFLQFEFHEAAARVALHVMAKQNIFTFAACLRAQISLSFWSSLDFSASVFPWSTCKTTICSELLVCISQHFDFFCLSRITGLIRISFSAKKLS